MVKMNDVIDLIEVGSMITVYREETSSIMSGTVTEKRLVHDPETHEEQGYLKINVDGMHKTITDITAYQVVSLSDAAGKDLLKDWVEFLKEYYFDEEEFTAAEIFWDMIEVWECSSETDRKDMAGILMKKMDAENLTKIVDEISEKSSGISKVAGGMKRRNYFDIQENS